MMRVIFAAVAFTLLFWMVRCSSWIKIGADPYKNKIVNVNNSIDGHLELEVEWFNDINRRTGALRLALSTNRGRR